MADTSNLSQFLTDVASAIKNKKGTTDKIPAANFDTEISNITTGVMTQKEYDECLTITNDILDGTTPYYTLNTDGLRYSLNVYNVAQNSHIDTNVAQEMLKSAYTIFITINPTSWNNYRGLFGFHGGDNQGIIGFQYEDGKLVYEHTQGNRYTLTPFSTGIDHNLIISYGNNKLSIYDGDTTLVDNQVQSDIVPLNNLIIGRAFNDNNRYFDGKLGYCYIYDRCLSTDEINSMKNYIKSIK